MMEPELKPRSASKVCSQHLCLHEGFSRHLPISMFPLEGLPSSGCSLSSATNLLCDFRQVTFPLWASMFPSANIRYPVKAILTAPILFLVIARAQLLCILSSVLHSRLGVPSGTQKEHSQKQWGHNKSYSLLGTCGVYLTWSLWQNLGSEYCTYRHLTEE